MKIPLYLAILALSCCAPLQSYDQVMQDFETQTGLREQRFEDGSGVYLGKVHRGYPMMVQSQMGDVWGRWGARVAMGEAGRSIGGIASFLTGSYEHVGTVVGSPLDRLLSSVIGQPLTIVVIARHDKHPSRLDILSSFSTVRPEDPQPSFRHLGFKVGSIYTADKAFGSRLLANQELIERLVDFRSQYIRVDEFAVTFTFSGSEGDYSAMMRENGGYAGLYNRIMDTLADIADAI